jgi:pimeloyl-ACP methyl ester carboxylesterase
MNVFQFDNLELNFVKKGEGTQPLVFLHGFLEDHTIWLNLIEEFYQEDFKIYLVDLPCHGKSRFYGDYCSIPSIAQLLNAFFSFEKIHDAFVLGHSLGGYVGLELAKLVDLKLVLIHSNFWQDSIEKQADRNRFIEVARDNKIRLINEVIPNLFAPENRNKCRGVIEQLKQRAITLPSSEIIAITAGMRDRNNNHEVLETGIVAIIQGEFDQVVKMSQMIEEIERLIVKPTLFTIANAGHMSIWENKDELIKSLKMIIFK